MGDGGRRIPWQHSSTRLAWCCLKANKQPKSKQNEIKEEQCPKWTMVSGAWKDRKSPTQTSLSNQCYTNVRYWPLQELSWLAGYHTLSHHQVCLPLTLIQAPPSSLPPPGGATQQGPGNSAGSRDPHPLLRAFPEKGNRAVGLGANPRQSWMRPKHRETNACLPLPGKSPAPSGPGHIIHERCLMPALC